MVKFFIHLKNKTYFCLATVKKTFFCLAAGLFLFHVSNCFMFLSLSGSVTTRVVASNLSSHMLVTSTASVSQCTWTTWRLSRAVKSRTISNSAPSWEFLTPAFGEYNKGAKQFLPTVAIFVSFVRFFISDPKGFKHDVLVSSKWLFCRKFCPQAFKQVSRKSRSSSRRPGPDDIQNSHRFQWKKGYYFILVLLFFSRVFSSVFSIVIVKYCYYVDLLLLLLQYIFCADRWVKESAPRRMSVAVGADAGGGLRRDGPWPKR